MEDIRENSSQYGQLLYRNFVFMALCFSANHGAVTSVIALSSSFNPTLGSYSVGILYALYVLTAMFAGPFLVTQFTSKTTLILSLGFYTIYVASYLFASMFPNLEWYLIIFGASIGGCGAGLLWCAQGVYFKFNTNKYANILLISEEKASSLFSSTFASWYLGLEVTLSFIGSMAAKYGSNGSLYLVYGLYSTICILSTFAMGKVLPMENSSLDSSDSSASLSERHSTSLSDSFSLLSCPLPTENNSTDQFLNYSLEESLTEETQSTSTNNILHEATPETTLEDGEIVSNLDTHHRDRNSQIVEEELRSTLSQPVLSSIELLTAALSLLVTNPKCLLMLPTNVSFGFASAFVTSYVGGRLVAPLSDDNDNVDDDDDASADYHNSQVLLYTSLAALVATVLTLPGFGFHLLRAKVGTRVVMFLGAFSFIVLASISFLFDGYTLRHVLWLVYVLYGTGRSVWENTVKSIFADFFSEQEAQAAFANVILQSGSSAAVGFFLFPILSGEVNCIIVITSAVLGYGCYHLAYRHHKRGLNQKYLLPQQPSI